MMQQNEFTVPTGSRVTVVSGCITNHRNGAQEHNVMFTAVPTDDVTFDAAGTYRRRFTDCEPPLFGERDIWLGEPLEPDAHINTTAAEKSSCHSTTADV